MKKVLFVCTGNTCRSPMAEALLKHKHMKNVEVKSAGIFAMEGLDASPLAKQVLNENDITFTHSSMLLTEKEVEWADLILTMSKSHKDFIVQQFEQAKGKTFLLKEFTGDGEQDVVDPFGTNIHTYRETFRELSVLVDKVVEKLAE